MIYHGKLNIFSWSDIIRGSKFLAMQIYKAGIPDFIVGIPRGGMIIATLLAEMLQKDLLTIYVSRRIDGIEVQETPFVKCPIPKEIIANKSILLVDEIVATGKTIQIATNYFNELGADQIKTCTFVNRSNGNFVSDFNYFSSREDCNVFPWDYLVLASEDTFCVHDEYVQMDQSLTINLYDKE